jgi:predicted PurR-regulated permease PerM
VLVIALVAIVLATLIEGPLQRLERRGIPRGVGILGIYAAFFGGLIVFIVIIAPFIADQARTFQEEAPQQLQSLQETWESSSSQLLRGTGADLLQRAIDVFENPPQPQEGTAFTVLSQTVTGIVGIFTTLALTFYYLMEKRLLRRIVLSELSVPVQERVARIWDLGEQKVGDWLRGQLTLCLIIGVTATVGYGVIGVSFWPVLGLWAGITEIIPILGPWLGGIPAVIIALTDSWQQGIIVAFFILLLQATENTVLVPRVMRGAVGLTPLTVFIAVTTGTEFYGPVGAILAIPLAAFIQVVLTEYLRGRRAAMHVESESAHPTWRWMREQLSMATQEPDDHSEHDENSDGEGPTSGTVAGANSANFASPEDSNGSAKGATRSPGRTAAPNPTAQPPPQTGPNWSADRLRRALHRPSSEPIEPDEPPDPSPPAIGPGGEL